MDPDHLVIKGGDCIVIQNAGIGQRKGLHFVGLFILYEVLNPGHEDFGGDRIGSKQ